MDLLVNGAEMKRCDEYTIQEIGIPSMVLMERAALGVVEELCGGGFDVNRVLVVCGTGNNGGDGFAAARLLHEKKINADAVLIDSEEKCTPETKQQLQTAKKVGVPILPEADFMRYTTIVDALFGIGLSRPAEGIYAEAINRINQSGADILSVDIPSGISADTGKVLGAAVRAKKTVTFAFRKIGLVLYPGAAYAGEVIVKKIGIGEAGLDNDVPGIFMLTKEDLSGIPKRNPYSNKGSFGKVLVVAGSTGMSGAAYFSAKAAYRTGAGLVRIYTPEKNRVILQTLVPEAMVTPYQHDSAIPYALKEAIRWADVIVIGPGLGKSEDALLILQTVLTQAAAPLVVDADALNLLAEHPELLTGHKQEIIVTPHPGEMSRLTGKPVPEIAENLIDAAKQYAEEQKVVCVLKDARTVTADRKGAICINTSGNSGMATGGVGDVLTGIIAGLIAQGQPCFEASALGVYLHGLAGDAAAVIFSQYSMTAVDILDSIQKVLFSL